VRTIVRNSVDVKDEIDRLWAERQRHVDDMRARFPTAAVLAAVAHAHGYGVTALRSKARTRHLAMARHHAVWELRRRRLDLSFLNIAAELDRTNHATAMHSWRVFCEMVRRGEYAAARAAVAAELGDAA
jgi:chromosomal replication initiation ATPase DnaA